MIHRIATFGLVLAVSISIWLPNAGRAQAQSPAGTTTPPFDVASVKAVPDAPGDYRANLGRAVHGEVTFTNATLSQCLRYAFGINNDDQISGPDWIKSRQFRYDIAAKGPPEAPIPLLRAMLQALLIERFKLVLHREQKDFAFLALVAGKNGPKIHESHDSPPAPGGREIMGAIISNHMSMEQLTLLLSRFLRQPVVDTTGLQGFFELKLQWTPENRTSPPSAVGSADTGAAPDVAPGPTIFEAVQTQLGLKLEPRKGPLEVIVVDRAEKVPVEN
jgi:uncharacterized protein (TIGR03435 family)